MKSTARVALPPSIPRSHGSSSSRNDWIRLFSVIGGFFFLSGIFFLTPALSAPSFLALLGVLMLGPWVNRLERRGLRRRPAALFVFLSVTGAFVFLGILTARSLSSQWESFLLHAPTQFEAMIRLIREKELLIKGNFPILKPVQLTDNLVNTVRSTSSWFIQNVPNWMGEFFNILLLAPIFTFYLLSEGPRLRKKVYLLVPNRFFESFFMVLWRISSSVTGYLRAKFVEAALVGLLTTLGLALVDAPYAFVLGTFAGITNILPYVGPVIGAAPGLIIAGFASGHATHFWPIFAVYLAANIIDNFLIFPIIVAKLVDLPPMVLIVAVILGQQYYGLVGMLISIPITTSLKIVLQEIHALTQDAPSQSNSS